MLEVATHSCGSWQGGVLQSAGEESEGCKMHSEPVCRAVDTVSFGGQGLLALLLSNEVYTFHLPSSTHL